MNRRRPFYIELSEGEFSLQFSSKLKHHELAMLPAPLKQASGDDETDYRITPLPVIKPAKKPRSNSDARHGDRSIEIKLDSVMFSSVSDGDCNNSLATSIGKLFHVCSQGQCAK